MDSDASHRLGITFDNVFLDDEQAIQFAAVHADITESAGTHFRVTGEDVKVTGVSGKGVRNTCEGKFLPFPD